MGLKTYTEIILGRTILKIAEGVTTLLLIISTDRGSGVIMLLTRVIECGEKSTRGAFGGKKRDPGNEVGWREPREIGK